MKPKALLLLLAVLSSLYISGCATLPREPVPLDAIEEAQVIGIPDVRAWGGQVSPLFQQDIVRSIYADRDNIEHLQLDDRGLPIYSGLALSGGGMHGAFGAGFLYGWSKTGKRPDFKLVSGISTGALIAPFAFLGEDYDEALKTVYTTTSTSQIAEFLSFFNVFRGESVARTDPLRKLLKDAVTDEMIADIAKVHDEGRRLYIGTTHMDAQRLVIWNMGLIAKSDSPDKAKIFREVMLASSSIPGAFPPVYFKVKVDGEVYDEMHTDGGTLSQVIFYAGTLDLRAATREVGFDIKQWPVGNLYIIRNGKLGPEPKQINRRFSEISERAISTMIKAAARTDLYRIYAFAGREGANFYYVDIPDDFEDRAEEAFDKEEMNRLFELGEKMGRAQDSWQTVPPGFTYDVDYPSIK